MSESTTPIVFINRDGYIPDAPGGFSATPAPAAPQFRPISLEEARRRQQALVAGTPIQPIARRRASWLEVHPSVWRRNAEGMSQGQRREEIVEILGDIQRGGLNFSELDTACLALDELFRAEMLDAVGALYSSEKGCVYHKHCPQQAKDSFDSHGLLKMAAETLNERVVRLVANHLGRNHNEGYMGECAMEVLLRHCNAPSRTQRALACLRTLLELKYPVRRETRELASRTPAAKYLFKDDTL